MRFLLAGLLAIVLMTSVLPAQADTDRIVTPDPAPVEVDSTTVPAATATAEAAKADPDAADLVAQLPAKRTADFGLVGVTWKPGFDTNDMTVQVRLRASDAWTAWKDLEIEADEGEGGRAGTEPLWVGEADGVAVRMASPNGQKPADAKVATIDPGATPASAPTTSNAYYRTAAPSRTVTAATSTPTFTSKPAIITRAKWGASAGTKCATPTAGETTRGVIVHHTAGTNSYSKSQSAAIVRATQAYHVKSRDWCDIGYNFLVDKYGQIFEGRKGGMDRTVRGAHAGNFAVNEFTMGVSMMGNFDKVTPSGSLKASTVRLIGWRIGTFYMAAKGNYTVDGKTLARIAGHRNVVSTACPGKYGYAWLSAKGGLRDRVATYTSDYASAAKSYFKTRGSANTGPIFIGEYPTAGGRKTRLKYLDILSLAGLGAHGVASIARTEYNRVGAEAGALGFPKTEMAPSVVDIVDVQRFQGGAIYTSREASPAKAFALWGPIAAEYARNGESSGRLGVPRGSIYTTATGEKRTNFQHGYITYSAADGAQVHP